MNDLSLDWLTLDKFSIEVSGNTVKFVGCIDIQDPEPIVVPYFLKIHEQILKKGLKEVVLDFRELNFINSSGIKTLTKWVMKIPALSDEQKYKLKLLYSEEITWQSTSLRIFTYLAPENIEIISG